MISPLPVAAQVLETDRLHLRPLGMEDMDLAIDLLCDPKVMRYVGGTAMTQEEAVAHMAQAVRKGAGGRLSIWAAVLKETGEQIGDGALLPLPIETDDTDWDSVLPDCYPEAHIEVGYLLKPAFWGKGYATEICTRLLRFGFEETDLDEIYAVTDAENAPSQHVLGKCGLQSLGTARAYAEDDTPWFRITRSEWATRG